MKKVFLHIYDFLSKRRWLAAAILAVVLGLCAFSAMRMGYEEDISAFLPQDEESARYSEIYAKLGGQDRIAVFFKGDDEEEIMEKMLSFEDAWAEADTAGLIPDVRAQVDMGSASEVFSFISANYPYFLTREDIARADSLLSVPGYIGNRLDEVKQNLYSPLNPFGTKYYRSDPLGLFLPVIERLSAMDPTGGANLRDGFLFTPDGTTGIILFSSPHSGSESGENAKIAALLEEVIGKISTPEITVTSTGGPLVAVGNASRIRKDSVLAISIALVLIALVLGLSFKRLDDVLMIVLAIAAGAVFALGLVSTVSSSVSIIILGIGCMILGIAVNYPLHYVDHLKFTRDRRKALGDQVVPLLVGNITTVGAFLSLLLVKAEALRDFGLIGAAMLVGTIIFVLVFMPVFTRDAKAERRTVKLDFDRHIKLSGKGRAALFICFAVLTTVLAIAGRNISFDSDMHHINYMTKEQSDGFETLSSMAGNGGGIFLVSTGETADKAIEEAEKVVPAASEKGSVRSILPFLPSKAKQKERLEAFEALREAHPSLMSDLRKESAARGFAPGAFSIFESTWESSREVQDADFFAPVTATLGQGMYLSGGDGVSVVSYLNTPKEEAEPAKEALRASMDGSSFCFDSSDVSSRLAGLLSEDFDKIGLICSLIVFVFLWISFGSFELALTAFLPLAVGWVWILGIMRLTGLQFNIVNIILATFIFGQGDDYSIFITEGLIDRYASGKKVLSSYKNCVVLSALIMFIGIGALITARHPAMRSLAGVTMIGMVTVVAMAYYLPPLIFRLLTEKGGKKRMTPVTAGRILATGWILLVFILAMIGISLVSLVWFVVAPRKKDAYHRFISRCARISLHLIPGCKYTSKAAPLEKPALIISNHQSHLDVLAILAMTPKVILLTNDWVWNNPYYGYIIRKAEFYPVSNGVEDMLPKLREMVSRGYSIAVYPEGTRSADCSIQRFHRGPFILAKELGLDILPVFIHGFGYALPKEELLLRKANLYMEAGERITEIPDDVRKFTRSLRHFYMAEYERIRREKETARYCAPFVRYQYLYKGGDAARECSDAIKRALHGMEEPAGETVEIRNAGCGAFAMLYAMTHRDKKVVAYESDPEKYDTAVLCSYRPHNLEFVKE